MTPRELALAAAKAGECVKDAFSPDGGVVDPACEVVSGHLVDGVPGKIRFSVDVALDPNSEAANQPPE